MVLFGLNCSDYSYSLLSNNCKAFALKSLMECDLFDGIMLSANCCFKCGKSNRGAIDLFELCLIRLFDLVDCDAFDS